MHSGAKQILQSSVERYAAAIEALTTGLDLSSQPYDGKRGRGPHRGLSLAVENVRSRLPLLADIVAKVFLGWRTKLLEPLMPFAHGDVRDHIVSLESITDLLSGAAERRSSKEVQRSTFARFLGVFYFRLLQQYLPAAEVTGRNGGLIAPRVRVPKAKAGCRSSSSALDRHLNNV